MTDLVLPALPATEPAADTLPLAAATPAPAAAWQVATLTTLREVEELLDMLEAHGVAEREVVVLRNDRFTVRWR